MGRSYPNLLPSQELRPSTRGNCDEALKMCRNGSNVFKSGGSRLGLKGLKIASSPSEENDCDLLEDDLYIIISVIPVLNTSEQNK